MKNEDSLLQSTLENSHSVLQTIEHELRSMGAKVSTTLGDQMPLPGGIEGV